MAGDINKSVNVAINVINGVSKQVGSIVSSFGKITDSANKSVKSISDLNKQLGKLKSPAGIKSLSKDLLSLSKVDGKGVEKLADGVKRLGSVKLPSFSKINTELATHIKRVNDLVSAYGRLQKASSKVNLKSFTSSAKTANKQVKTLGSSSKKTSASFSQWGYALGSASTGLSKFGTQIYGVTRGFSAVSKEMGLAMAAFTAGFATLFALKGVISDIVVFDDAIRSAGAVAQASSVQLTQLSDAARSMGESTRYTATDAAEALKALSMTGLDVNESISTLPTVLNLAAAANMNLGQSADIVTNIMVGFRKNIEDLPKIADLMTAAFTNSNTSLEELGVALKYVGPVAEAAGQSLEETTGILASLANAGYRGSKAGTTLRTALSRLLAPTNKMIKVLDNYDIALNDLTNDNGTMKSFTEILDIMGEKSITAGDALTIFGKRAGPGMLSLIAQGTPAIEEMNRKIAESEGTALKAAYEMENGLGGALRRLKSMWEEVSIAVGKTIENDVEGFVTALTKSLKENKDQIVSVVSALFTFVGVIAKVVGWMAQFVSEHFKVLSAMAAITVSIKLLTMTSEQFMEIGIVRYFASLFTSVKWGGIATGIGSVATQLNTYSKSAKTATSGNLVQSLSGLGSIKFTSIVTGLKNIGSAIISLVVNTGKAIAAFMVANPVILGITVTIGGLIGAIKLLDNNYEDIASSSMKMANSSKEANRELSYQLAELGLINKELSKENSNDFANSEERLRDVLKISNISLEDKIRLLKMSRDGSESTQEAIDELTKTLVKEKDALNTKEILNATNARLLQSKAVDEQAKKLEFFYDIQLEKGSKLNAAQKSWKKVNDFNESIKIINLFINKSKAIGENIAKYEELSSKQKVIEGNYRTMTAQMITSGKSTEDFNEALKESGASVSEIEKITKAYAELKEEAEKNKEVMDDLNRLSDSAIEEFERDGKIKLDNFKKNSSEREAVEKQTLYNISAMEAKGTTDHETSEMAKLQATLDFAQQRVNSAKETYGSINELAEKSRSDAMRKIISAEENAASIRFQTIEKISASEKVANDKLIKLNKDRTKEVIKNENKLEDLQGQLDTKRTDASEAKASKIKEIEANLATELKSIEDDLAAKRNKLAEDRVNVIKSSIQKIQNIESSTQDKLRSIRQRGMSDEEKNANNRETAQNKLVEGQKLVAEAQKTGDNAALERGIKLIEQSSDLSFGLNNEKDATDGVKKASDLLKDAEEIRAKISLADIAKKVKAEKDAAAKSKELAEEIATRDKDEAGTEYDKKIKAAEDYYSKEKKKEDDRYSNAIINIDNEITKYNEKLQLIENEKQLIIDLIEKHRELSNIDPGSDVWTKANKATDDAIGKVEDYGDAVNGLSDKNINIKFTGEASPKQGLGKTLSDIQEKFKEISTEIGVNVKFKTGDKDLTSGLVDIKHEIESIDINIPVSVDIKELDAAVKIINEYRKKYIKVTVKVDSGELNTTSNVLKKMVNKTVTLTMKVIGYDNLVKAKNMLDSIRSKTVTVTTKHVDVGGKASGGYIEPEHYATGGDVFKRLGSRFIGSGGGKKDDVPAMLMKGEFVQKVSAVKKYGKEFMSRLNAGLIPSTVTKMFSDGGDVQPEHYASGGHVGYNSLVNKMRKKYDERMIEKRDNLAGTMNLSVNNNLNGIKGMTKFGSDAVSSLKSIIQSSVSSFASGGSLSDSSSVNDVARSLNSDYNKKISAAKKAGDSALADLLLKEQKDVAELSKKLAEDLKLLEEQYEKFKKDSTEEHVKKIDEIKKTYESDIGGLDTSHSRDLEDIKTTYLQTIFDLDNSQTSTDNDYKKAIDKYKEDRALLKEDEDKEESDNAIIHQESIMSGHDLGKKIHMILGTKNVNNERDLRTKNDNAASKSNGPGNASLTGRSHAGSFTLDEIEAQNKLMDGSGYISYGDPDFKSMKNMLGQAFPELKSFLNGTPSTGMENIANEPTRIKMDSGMANSEKSSSSENMGSVSVSFMTVDDGMELAKDIFDIEKSFNESSISVLDKKYKDLFKAISDNEELTKETYKNDSKENSDKKKSETDAYELDKSRKIYDYNLSKSNYDSQYNDDINEENKSYEKLIIDATDTYNTDKASLKSEYTSSKDTINEATKEEVDAQKDITDSDINSLKITLEEELKKIGVTSKSSSDLTSFFKDFKIRGFNTGGHVNPTASSIPGKDSILSALTPNEYVMKASVVKRFGKGFFDSLNNFKIPQFNTGGIVGGDSSILSNVDNTVKHTLDLSINGNRQGELTGSPVTIEKILNDLTLAKMRA